MIYNKKIIFLSVLVSLFILSIFSCQSLGEEQVKTSTTSNPLRVLFVGNALTYSWNLQLQVETLAQDLGAEPKVEAEAIKAAGVSLLWHLSPEYSDTLDIIRTGNFNIVVIQEMPQELLKDSEGFLKDAMALADEVKTTGAEVVFCETWAFDPKGLDVVVTKIYEKSWSGGNPEGMQALIREAYTRATSEAGGHMARVGDAWEIVLTGYPEIELYNSDGAISSECGSYLAACVLVNVLTNLDPRDAKWRPEGVSKKEAIVLRSAAWEVSNKQ